MNSLLRATDEFTVIESPDRGYFPHDVFKLQNGTLIAAINDRANHSSIDGKIASLMSRDGGKSWGEYRLIKDAEVPNTDYRDPSIMELSDGTLLCTFFEWRGTTHKRNWDGSVIIVMRSHDGGDTWSAPQRLTTGPLDFALTTERCIELPSGRILMPVHGGSRAKRYNTSSVFYSDDKGESWDFLSTVLRLEWPPEARWSMETSLVRAGSGRIIAVARSNTHMYEGISHDDGRTWEVKPLPDTPRETQPSLNLLSNGMILLAYGDRKQFTMHESDHDDNANRSITLRLSSDEGETWSEPILLREYLPHPDMGYPTSAEVEPGKVLTLYWRSVARSAETWPNDRRYYLSARFWEVPEL